MHLKPTHFRTKAALYLGAAFFIGFLTQGMASPAGEPNFLEPSLANRPDILFFGGFETDPWKKAWGMAWGPEPESQGTLVKGLQAFQGRSLRVRYPKGTFSSGGGLQFLSDFSRLAIVPHESLYLRYYLRFDPHFDFVKGGKLPGLAGGAGNTGGHKPNGTDGWSARIMWRADGKIVQYVYHPDQPGEYGEDFAWDYGGCPRYFKPGFWHCVETYVQMNTPGKKDGIIRSWLDGDKALEISNLRFRDIPTLQIDKLEWETFFGGGDESWAPPKDEYADFDNFVVAENYIGPAQGVIVAGGNQNQVSGALHPPSPPPSLLYFAGDGVTRGPVSHWSDGVYDLDAKAPLEDKGSKGNNLAGHCVQVQLPDGKWGGIQFEGPLLKRGDYRTIRLRVLPTGCNVEFRVRLELNGSQVGMEKAVTGARGWAVNQWNEVELPLSDFEVPDSFNRVVLNSNGPKAVSAFYVDEIGFGK